MDNLRLIYEYKYACISVPTTVPAVDCGDPPTPDHGTVTLTIAGVTTEGATAHQACNTGYDISGASDITCNASGSWSAASVLCSLTGNY